MSDRSARWSAAAPLVNLGFATAVAQAVLLREAMSALAGSELAWSGVLGVWLAGMGCGSWLGARGRARRWGASAPIAVIVAAAAGALLLRATPAILHVVAGEAVATWRAAWVWILAVLPASLAGGWGFPTLAAALDGNEAARRAYALDGAGALAGGLAFTFALAPFGSAATLTLALGVTVALALLARRRFLIAAIAFVAVVVAAAPVGKLFARARWEWSARAGQLAAWRETRQQCLDLASGPPSSVYADGRLLLTFPDAYRIAPRTHLLALLHPRPRRVLGIGLLASGGLPELLRHPVERVDLVEEDPAFVDVLPAWLGARFAASLRDARVRVHAGDPLRVVGSSGPWDLVLVLDPDPATLRLNRTRTVEFFRAVASALAPGGVVAVRVGASDTYLGGTGGELVALEARTLREALSAVQAVPGEEITLVGAREGAALRIDPHTLADRWNARGLYDPVFSAEMIPLLLDPERAATLARFLSGWPADINRAQRPRAVLLAAALAEGRGSVPVARALAGAGRLGAWPWYVLVGAASLFLVARGGRGRGPGAEVAAVVGFTSLGWWLLLLLAWQATRGAVYSEIGALSAAFMAGLTLGAAATRRWAWRAQTQIGTAFAGGAAISIVIALGVPMAAPRMTIVPLLVAAGALTGAAFGPAAALAGRGRPRLGAGVGFAADELGAAGGALAVGLFVAPTAGVQAAALGLGVLQLAALISVTFSVRRGRSSMEMPS